MDEETKPAIPRIGPEKVPPQPREPGTRRLGLRIGVTELGKPYVTELDPGPDETVEGDEGA